MHMTLRIALAVVTGLGFGTMAMAQSSPLANGSTLPDRSSQKTAPVDKHAVKPGDRNCVRSTGSLIPAKQGACLPVIGRSYSGDELRRTGDNDTGRALEALDPSISVGH
ncbi:MAG TPA: hypothetical protein VGC19_01170 [Rhodanobacter sp.]